MTTPTILERKKKYTRKEAEVLVNKPDWKHSLACYAGGDRCFCFDFRTDEGFLNPIKLQKELVITNFQPKE